jgi:hypothetical protein
MAALANRQAALGLVEHGLQHAEDAQWPNAAAPEGRAPGFGHWASGRGAARGPGTPQPTRRVGASFAFHERENVVTCFVFDGMAPIGTWRRYYNLRKRSRVNQTGRQREVALPLNWPSLQLGKGRQTLVALPIRTAYSLTSAPKLLQYFLQELLPRHV